jgi:hypothetical protein
VREVTLEQVDHPTAFRVDPLLGTPFSLTSFAHPSLAKVVDGDPVKGWEGDNRLAWYFDAEAQRIVLMRLEWDNQYRTVLVTPPFTIPNDEMANRIVDRLVAQDVRRGFDVKASVDANNAKVDAEKRRLSRDRNEDIAEKLMYALKKDGV